MLKRISIVLLFTILVMFCTSADMVREDTWQTICVNADATVPDSMVFTLPKWAGVGKPSYNGYINILIEPITIQGATDALTISLKEVYTDSSGNDRVCKADSIVLRSDLDWTTGFLYTNPVVDAFGPCGKIVVYYWFNATVGTDSMNVRGTMVSY